MTSRTSADSTHRVHRLYPLGIDVAVEDDPLVLVDLVVGHVTEGDADEALLPLAGLRVDVAVQLVARHRLSWTKQQSNMVRAGAH